MSERISEDKAGYMELVGAHKDADCTLVAVKGGVSKQLGCCNHYEPKPNAQDFCCGKCTMATRSGHGSP